MVTEATSQFKFQRWTSTALLAVLVFLSMSAFAQNKEVLLSVSIDYEGEPVRRENIEAIQAFRRKFPQVRFIHFLNAASFTVEGVDAEETTRLLRSVINPEIDEIGLHIHSRRSLVQASGVKFRTEPTYLGDADPKYVELARSQNLLPWQEPKPVTAHTTGRFGEPGDDVPFWAYSESEQRQIIRKSLDILKANGFTGIRSFRAGGWSASPTTWRALKAEGIDIDSSAVPPEIISKLYGKSYLMHFNQQIWKGTNKTSQPYKINLGSSEIMQFPNNGGLADYQSPQEFFESFQAALEHDPKAQKVTVHIGFHLESAAQYLENVFGAMDLITDYSRKKGIKLTSATFKSWLESKVPWAPTRNAFSELSCKSVHQ